MTAGPRSALILVAAVLSMGIVLQKVTHLPFTGDEPGYLIQAESLWHDRDVDLSNNVGSGTRLGAVTPDTQPETVLKVGRSIVPVQPPGLPLLLTPAVALGRSASREVNLARVTIGIFAVAAFVLLLRTLTSLRPERHHLALLLVLATVMSLAGGPWIVLIYPEVAPGSVSRSGCTRWSRHTGVPSLPMAPPWRCSHG